MPRVYGRMKKYRLHAFKNRDGSFDYDRYRAVQERANRDKIDLQWATEDRILRLSEHIVKLIGQPRFGICHGTRRGAEQAWFRQFLPGCHVIGTEIASTATQFPHTIQWDFHDVKPEWIDTADFIYSNSFDHTYDPKKCLNAWMSCVRPGGICIIEHSDRHTPDAVSETDPFGATVKELRRLIGQWGGSGKRYGLYETIRPSGPRRDIYGEIVWLVIARSSV